MKVIPFLTTPATLKTWVFPPLVCSTSRSLRSFSGLPMWHSAAVWFGRSDGTSHTNADAAEYCGARRALSAAAEECATFGEGT